LSAEAAAGGPSGAGGPDQSAGEPSEEELRAAYEAELSRISATDMIAQTAVSLLNIGAHRLAPAGEGGHPEGHAPSGGARDLEQARDAIDAVKALLEILARRIPRELAPLRDALSRLQMAYAHEARAAGVSGEPAPAGGAAPAQTPPQPGGNRPAPAGGEPAKDEPQPGPGPAESSGRLWVPGR